ncbi:uncharacterized protein LOC113642534 [Tachysurus fulvidraco]|uniref:uncharacterized protein LOC113642534 n=1 Tax=Tachysurus fulvidraco TaxID=1234273 RepID=UPI001FEE9B57|nr:uncharacterized protein LOC113642534 [Tachysurus fulvidraco]XP_027001890.2 uncharacterized protein LOC113642534 [Tachysurus fulvidraco]XP_027001891.2 uncharacterized protein LOC113642534 [Tachysurus fulvidraco]XP_027001893.2 uncharacterized protein LOC113642534 [Tachysurus fulvidraco]XP_027001894.2 uncharacterized protein LOC113642534 [Tachysurus fulvidraco]
MNTLSLIDDLEQSRFGQPPPRHGLKLLYWFATDCLTFDQNNVMQSCCDPQNGQFGFHIFENKYERNFGKLLPNVALPYYEVGNLGKAGAYRLPCYVRKDYTRLPDDSNMDRIIVSFNKNDNSFDRVFVTQHRDLSNFNKLFTYNISKGLIMMIRNLTSEEFLLKTGYLKQQPNQFPCSFSEELNKQQPPCPALPITSICSPLQDVCPESKSPWNLMMNNIVEHHKTPPETSICIVASTSSTNQDIYGETESTSNLMNNAQRHHEASLTSSMCSPSNTTSTTQDFHWEVKSLNLMNNNTQEHHEAPPTPSFYNPAHTSSMTLDILLEVESPEISVKNHTQEHHEAPPTHSICTPATSTTPNVHTETESPPVFTNTNPQIHTNGAESQLNNVVQKSPSSDIPVTSSCTPTSTSSKDQDTENESFPFLQFTSFFWGFYLLSLFFFFYFFWSNVTQICITVLFVSSLVPWQKRKRGEQREEMRYEEKNSNSQKAKMKKTGKRKKKGNNTKMLAFTTRTLKVMSSKIQNTDIDSSPFSQFTSFFWGFYLLSLFSFFYFFWGYVARIFMIVVFVASCRWQIRKIFRERERERERERKRERERERDMHAVTISN